MYPYYEMYFLAKALLLGNYKHSLKKLGTYNATYYPTISPPNTPMVLLLKEQDLHNIVKYKALNPAKPSLITSGKIPVGAGFKTLSS